MFSFFKRKSEEQNEEILPITLPLANIQKIDDTEILYHDNEGALQTSIILMLTKVGVKARALKSQNRNIFVIEQNPKYEG